MLPLINDVLEQIVLIMSATVSLESVCEITTRSLATGWTVHT